MEAPRTYCNPLPIPDYPIGRLAPEEHGRFWRELADPTVLYEDGVWYLYPSCGMVWWSEDFVTWRHKRLDDTYDVGYAPTVVRHRGRYWLLACRSELYVADAPLGPFRPAGPVRAPDGSEVREDDPMLFSDDDGRLYLYFGSGGRIRGAELDAADPTRLLAPPATMFEMDTAAHPWERLGAFNVDPNYSWIEGAWMFKRGGVYYLTYAGPGTEFPSYAMGAYRGRSPLGPWEYVRTSPFLSGRHGLVNGPGHGCLVRGPGDSVWAFYTCCVCHHHRFERRIGMDRISFDANGDIVPTTATETPQPAPGSSAPAPGWLPLNRLARCEATSCAPGRDAIYACDGSMLSWWQPAPDDPAPSLTTLCAYRAVPLPVAAVRVLWRDVGLDPPAGARPGPFGYRVEAETSPGVWRVVLDRSDAREDFLCDYRELPEPVAALRLRLCVTSHPPGVEPGVIDFTAFGPVTAPATAS